MDAPYRWRVADNQAQRTLGGNIMELHETGPYVLWHDYVRLQYKSQCQTEVIDAFDKKLREAQAEVERLKEVIKAQAKGLDEKFGRDGGQPSLSDSPTWQAIGAYAELKEDYARLKAEVERLEHQVNYWRIEAETDNARWLRCLEDKERLTKAGDEMALNLTHIGWNICVEAWNAAKEGKQS